MTKITQTDEPDPPRSAYHQVQDKRVDFDYNALGQFTSIKRWENLTGTGEKIREKIREGLSDSASIVG